MTPGEARQVLLASDLICDAETVQAGIRRMAGAIDATLSGQHPLLLVVMHGGVFLAGQILPLLEFPLELDYVQVGRYGQATQGGALTWKVPPPPSVAGRAVLILDDILDAGVTLAEVRDRVLAAGARSVHCAVLTEKETGRAKPVPADFVGLPIPDRFVFGCGMDIAGAWRNLPVIRAAKGV